MLGSGRKMTYSRLVNVEALLELSADSFDVHIDSSELLSTLDVTNSYSSQFLVINLSPHRANVSHNYWGDALQAVTGSDPITGSPVYALSSFIYDVFSNVMVGEVLFAPFAAAPPPPPPPSPHPPSPSPPEALEAGMTV